jgi:hypothetical protein
VLAERSPVMLSAHAAGNRVPCGDRLVVRETSTGGVEALRLTALTGPWQVRTGGARPRRQAARDGPQDRGVSDECNGRDGRGARIHLSPWHFFFAIFLEMVISSGRSEPTVVIKLLPSPWKKKERAHGSFQRSWASLRQFDRRNWPPGGPILSHWGAEEEV